MSVKVVDSKMLLSDIRSLTCRARGMKQRITNAFNCSKAYPLLERAFNERGYNYKIDKVKKTFTVEVSSNFFINGKIVKNIIKIGMTVCFDDMEFTNNNAASGVIDFPVSDLELYLPLVDKLVTDGTTITEKYYSLRKQEKAAQLLESLVIVFLEKLGVSNIDVSCDTDGVVRLHKCTDKYMVRVPVDVNNYKGQCEKWVSIWNIVLADPGRENIKN